MKYLQLVQTQQSLFAYISLDEITFFSSLNNSQQNLSYSIVFLFRSGETKNINACFKHVCLPVDNHEPQGHRQASVKNDNSKFTCEWRIEGKEKCCKVHFIQI